MKRKLKKRFFIALVLCISLFNFSHFYQDESKNNENLNISTIAYASGETNDGGVGDDEWVFDPYTKPCSMSTTFSIIDWVKLNITKLFTTDEDITSIPVEKK